MVGDIFAQKIVNEHVTNSERVSDHELEEWRNWEGR